MFISLSGEGDVVRCFCCNLGLSEWAATDDPWIQHARHFQKCWFLRTKKSQTYINNVQEEWKKVRCSFIRHVVFNVCTCINKKMKYLIYNGKLYSLGYSLAPDYCRLSFVICLYFTLISIAS